jgi:hypothetical protein
MEQNNEKQKRKNMIVGWAIGIMALGLYVGAIYFGAGRQ